MYKLLLLSTVWIGCASALAQAETLTTIDQTFFNVGGPSQALTAIAPTTTVKQPDPMPDPALFTQVQNLSEQNHDNAVDIFGLGKRATATTASAGATVIAPDGTTVAATPPVNQSGMPDPSLFTNTGTPKDQTRDHPFKLF
ncbi:hypothetical protein SAMN02745130_03002 [Thiothrix eikelboomii]|uniref:Uncharacterized protein n=1 Tax=Thiothrix eikelboomii TaxID=92487 RepID=A0A1T4XHA5_9GAMM|nr:hypothetical protein [Thiothrix eikelboomii]SKA88817.1 hypothetical protein SAMN02745130_03002 [Thiothrix eikelboomii]